jgi:hypothetical protein
MDSLWGMSAVRVRIVEWLTRDGRGTGPLVQVADFQLVGAADYQPVRVAACRPDPAGVYQPVRVAACPPDPAVAYQPVRVAACPPAPAVAYRLGRAED